MHGRLRKVALPIVEVKVSSKGSDDVVLTKALLDSGSNRTFCTTQLASMLRAPRRTIWVTLDTITQVTVQQTEEIDLVVSSKHSRKLNSKISLFGVIVTRRLPSTLKDSVASAQDTTQWSHLAGIEPLNTYDGEVQLLIGLDVPQALTPLEVRAGGNGEPFAIRTLLGWTISGPVQPSTEMEDRPNDAGCVAIVDHKSQETRLEEQVRQFWELDTSYLMEEIVLSVEDKRVMDLWSGTLTRVKGHYQLPIPFRQNPPKLPDNKSLALRRLEGLKRRLLRDPSLRRRYAREMQLLLDEGYAELVPTNELHSRPHMTWYLPHHPVLNPNKPDKVRIVFDCAAECGSVSLNSQVLQGPDLNNKLLGVLLRFRQGPVALMADIEAMFHQVKVAPEHRDALRFLWWPKGDVQCAPKAYRMTVHLFGGVWSPSCASYALKRTFLDHTDVCPADVGDAQRNFYVDDLLISVQSATEGIRMAEELRRVTSLGGFRLTKWASNSKEVLESIPEVERHKGIKEIDLERKPLPVERALGVRWDLEDDQMAVVIKSVEKGRPTTRRDLLRVISSVYDPLGFLAPFLIRAKVIFQEECRRKKGWDEAISEISEGLWQQWMTELTHLTEFRMPRCYDPKATKGSSYQLHHFCDASQVAYGVVSYLRISYRTGDVHLAFVYGKAKLAPLKQLTIPRLELCAAVLAVKVDETLRHELSLDLGGSVFWTDSVIVLQYIRNTERRFHTFVANRVATIHEHSEVTQWRHVGSLQNPADDATRGLSCYELNGRCRWIEGPDFLQRESDHWPMEPRLMPDLGKDSEVKGDATVMMMETRQEENPLVRLWARYSSWHKLLRGVSWIRRFLYWRLRRGLEQGDKSRLKVSELQASRTAVLGCVQREHYEAEIKDLKERGALRKTSPLFQLEPHLGEDGLLRAGGRLKRAPLSTDSKYPVLLPRDHRITELIVRETHENKAGHSGREHTLAVIRQEFWVPKGRRLIDQVLKTCLVCRRVNWKESLQRQADLPADRVCVAKAPFTCTGVDCFGPFDVKQGRKRVKRWGCLFTCLTSRAIHLEILDGLDADSFLNAITRFSARRGVPERIRSDNGTNMVRADKELRAAALSWERDDNLQNALLKRQIAWEFNPPHASHMGGVWERQIRTVRKVLQAIIGEQVVDEERLHTLFCEVEAIVNGRPITPTSNNIDDIEALTPLHILRPKTLPHCSLGGKDEEPIGNIYQKGWKHAQFLADQFWKRWLRVYLPSLRQRQRQFKQLRNFQVGDVVLLTDWNVPRNQWGLGRVVEATPGEDGLVRKVRVRTAARKFLTRPVNKLCLLEGRFE